MKWAIVAAGLAALAGATTYKQTSKQDRVAAAKALLTAREQYEEQGHTQLSRWCNSTVPAQSSRKSALEHLLEQAYQTLGKNTNLASLEKDASTLQDSMARGRIESANQQAAQTRKAVNAKLDLGDAATEAKALAETAESLKGTNPKGAKVVDNLAGEASKQVQELTSQASFLQSNTTTGGNHTDFEQDYTKKRAEIDQLQHTYFTTSRSLEVLTSALEDESAYLADLQSICGAEERVHQRMESEEIKTLKQAFATFDVTLTTTQAAQDVRKASLVQVAAPQTTTTHAEHHKKHSHKKHAKTTTAATTTTASDDDDDSESASTTAQATAAAITTTAATTSAKKHHKHHKKTTTTTTAADDEDDDSDSKAKAASTTTAAASSTTKATTTAATTTVASTTTAADDEDDDAATTAAAKAAKKVTTTAAGGTVVPQDGITPNPYKVYKPPVEDAQLKQEHSEAMVKDPTKGMASAFQDDDDSDDAAATTTAALSTAAASTTVHRKHHKKSSSTTTVASDDDSDDDATTTATTTITTTTTAAADDDDDATTTTAAPHKKHHRKHKKAQPVSAIQTDAVDVETTTAAATEPAAATTADPTAPDEAMVANQEAAFDQQDDATTQAPHRHLRHKGHKHGAATTTTAALGDRDSDGTVYDDDDLPKHRVPISRGLEGGWKAFLHKGAAAKKPELGQDVTIMQSLYGQDGTMPKQYAAWKPEEATTSTPPAADGGDDSDSAEDDASFVQVEMEMSDPVGHFIRSAAEGYAFLEETAVTVDASRAAAGSVLLARYAEVLDSKPLRQLVKAKLSPTKLKALYKKLARVDPLDHPTKASKQAEQACLFFEDTAQSSMPVVEAVSLYGNATAALAEASSRQAAVGEEVDARTQLLRAMQQDVKSLAMLLKTAQLGEDVSTIRGVGQELERDGHGDGELPATAAGLRTAHAEIADLVDMSLTKRQAALDKMQAKLTVLDAQSKQAGQDVTKKKKALLESKTNLEQAQKKLSGIQQTCQGALQSLETRRHVGHMEAKAIESVLKVVGTL